MVNYTKKFIPVIKSISPFVFAIITTILILIPAYVLIGFESTNIYEILFLSSIEILSLGIGAIIFMYISKDFSIISSRLNKFSYNYFKIIHWDNLKFKDYFIWVVFGTSILISINFIINIITVFIGVEIAENAIFGIAEDNPVYILYFIPIMLLLVAPVEELLFRGILQSVLRESYNMNIGLFIASLLFGLIHIPAAGGISMGALAYVITTFLLGYVLGYIYEIKKSLLIPIVIHGVYNSILLIGFYYVQISM